MQLNKDKLITEKQKKEGLNTDSIPIHSQTPLPLDEDETAASLPERTGSRKEAAYQIYRDLILENIEYDTLTQNPRIDREQLDEIVDILLETVCTSRKSIRVAGDDYPAELVKAKFLKLDSHHIEFVMDCLRDNTTKVRNIKQYLRAMLFNAPSTINSYYASLVAHDMAQPDWPPAQHLTERSVTLCALPTCGGWWFHPSCRFSDYFPRRDAECRKKSPRKPLPCP